MLSIDTYMSHTSGGRPVRCQSCGLDMVEGQQAILMDIKVIAVPFDQRRQYVHARCMRRMLDATPSTDVDDIDAVIAGVRQLVKDFS